MPRMTVKLLLLDEDDRVLMVHGTGPRTGSPTLGDLLASLLRDGPPDVPVDISGRRSVP